MVRHPEPSLVRREAQQGASAVDARASPPLVRNEALQGHATRGGGGGLVGEIEPLVPSHTFEARITGLRAQQRITEVEEILLHQLRTTLRPRHWQTGLSRFGQHTRSVASHFVYEVRGDATRRRIMRAPIGGHAQDLRAGTRNAMIDQLLVFLEDIEIVGF